MNRVLAFVLGSIILGPTSMATVISPSSKEVAFSYASEFQTADTASDAAELAKRQASNLFGYMQNPEIVRLWGAHKVGGIGAPAWVPKLTILSDQQDNGKRAIRYEATGRLLLINSVATKLVRRGHWDVTLPYDLDNYYDRDCTDDEYYERSDFWYFGDPFRKGCEKLRQEGLAKPVSISIEEIPNTPKDFKADLDGLRVDNGHDLFQVTAINGFDESSRKRKDDGRVNYEAMNKWFVANGFTDTFISKYKERPIHQFDKTVTRADGREIHIRVTRLLAQTELEGNRDVTFAKFFEKMLNDSDVIIYEGHSGLGVNLELSAIEKRAGIEASNIDPHKRQLFLFDSCSSYSYYLGMFDGRKDPGKLNVLSNGLESVFSYEIPETKHLYNILFDVNNNDYTWLDVIDALEKPFRGTTFMMNMYIND